MQISNEGITKCCRVFVPAEFTEGQNTDQHQNSDIMAFVCISTMQLFYQRGNKQG